ncbi:hypothetical protein ABK040_004094 [Willaertia magna]
MSLRRDWELFLPKEIIFHILDFIEYLIYNENEMMDFIHSISLINKIFYESSLDYFNTLFYKEMLMNHMLIHVTSDYKKKLLLINFENNYKQLFALLNHYSTLQIKENIMSSQVFKPDFESDTSVNITVCGDWGVGKTTMIKCFFDYHQRRIINTYYRQCFIDNVCYEIKVLDLPTFNDNKKDYWIEKTDGVVIAFDLTKENSLNYVEEMLKKVYRSRIPIFVVGTKLDNYLRTANGKDNFKDKVESVIDNIYLNTKIKPIYREINALYKEDVFKIFSGIVNLHNRKQIEWNNVIDKLLKGEDILQKFN